MNRNAHIAVVGARTPVGFSAEASAASVRADICQLVEHPFLLDNLGQPIRSAMDAALDPKLLGWERLVELAKTPLIEVAEKLASSCLESRGSSEVLLGLPEYRPGWTKQDSKNVLQTLNNLELPPLGSIHVRAALSGHAGALAAIGDAAGRITRGELDLCLVVGVDSYLNKDTLKWLHDNKQLACEDVRTGFFPGEAAGCVGISSKAFLRNLRLPPLATVCGYHTATETKLIKTNAINLGEAMTTAVSGAVRNLRLPEQAVDTVYCDINGERYRSEEWGFVALKLPYACKDATAYELTTATWGDVGAASGPLFAAFAVAGWQRGYAPGPRALLVAGSEGGLRAALVLKNRI